MPKMRRLNDPHLQKLSYAFVPLEGSYDLSNTRAWEGALAGFRCRLADRTLVAEPDADFPDAASGRAALEPHLRGWEVQLELERGIWIEFRFEGAEVIDRQPAAGSRTVALEAAETARAIMSADVIRGLGDYPAPPTHQLAETPFVEALRARVRDVRHQRERLLVAAYWCLTQVEGKYGNRAAAAAALNVSKNVLETIGRLTAIDDPQEGRKAGGPARPLIPAERQWLDRVLRAIVLRVAQVEAAEEVSTLPQITLADFGGDPS
jgi:hypothetical protein